MIVSRTIVASYVAVIALLSACAGRHHAELEDDAEVVQPVSGPVILEVQNHNWSDVVLFLIHNGQTNRFAQIAAAKDQSFEIPPRSGPRYRAGIEFVDADGVAIEGFCHRHKAT